MFITLGGWRESVPADRTYPGCSGNARIRPLALLEVDVDSLKARWRRLPRWAQVTVKVLVFVLVLALSWLLAISGRDSLLPQ